MSQAVIDVIGEEIYEIFVEEAQEIRELLQANYPKWLENTSDKELLGEIRRSFHTLKGSGRMAGALALGDFAWAYENMLNHVISEKIAVTPKLLQLLEQGIQYFSERITFFVNSCEKDEGIEQAIDVVEQFMQAADQEVEDASQSVTERAQIFYERPEIRDVLPKLVPDIEVSSEQENYSEDQQQEAFKTETSKLADSIDELQFNFRIHPDISAQILSSQAEQLTNSIGDESTLEQTLHSNIPMTNMDEYEEAQLVDLDQIIEPDPFEDDDPENALILQLFREEAHDQLEALDAGMLRLQEQPDDLSMIQSMERELHTLKGGARMVRINNIADLAHDAETLLEGIAEARGAVSPEQLEQVQTNIDQISRLLDQYDQQKTPETSPEETQSLSGETLAQSALGQDANSLQKEYSSLLEQMLIEQREQLVGLSTESESEKDAETEESSQQESRLTAAPIQDQVRLPTLFLDQMVEQSASINIQQGRLQERVHSMSTDVGELGNMVSRLRQLLRSLELETEARVHAGFRDLPQANREGFDPLEMDEYSELQRLSRALAESLNDLINIEGDLTEQLRRSESAITDGVQAGRKMYQDLLETRLIALSVLTPRLRRVVRQTASDLHKRVELDIQGEDCELDRHLLQHLTAPLEHLLRNAIAHGIEKPKHRLEADKPEQGKITLKMGREDTEIVIQVIDDGAGFNRTALRQKAIEKGYLEPEDTISDVDLDRLILQPGFTTAAEVDQTSGRGVGMDVVFSEIKALGGSLQIHTDPGHGSSFILRVPFTMASNPVLFTVVQGQTYGLPFGSIRGLIRLPGKEMEALLNHDTDTLHFDDHDYPVRYLGQALRLRGLREIPADQMYPIVFMRSKDKSRAWVVDAIAGRHDVVMQSLGVLFKNCPFYSAATITPDGQVVLLPDIHEILVSPMPKKWNGIPSGNFMKRANDMPRIMVVDDSITVRKVTEKFLSTKSYSIQSAKDGMEALEKLDNFKPDIMLLDIEMPRMDGFELLGHLRMSEQWKNLPVIMISSRTAEKHRAHAASLGATDFLGKPYQNQDLLEKIKEHLEGASLLSEVTA